MPVTGTETETMLQQLATLGEEGLVAGSLALGCRCPLSRLSLFGQPFFLLKLYYLGRSLATAKSKGGWYLGRLPNVVKQGYR